MDPQLSAIEDLVDDSPMITVHGKVAHYPGVITVYNTNGQTVAGGKDAVSLQHLSRGIYILQGRSGSHVKTVKIAIGS